MLTCRGGHHPQGSTVGFTYDNLTRDSTNNLYLGCAHHLSAIGGDTSASFVYDAFGRRMSKSINAIVT